MFSTQSIQRSIDNCTVGIYEKCLADLHQSVRLRIYNPRVDFLPMFYQTR
jgi:hypothetical protein